MAVKRKTSRRGSGARKITSAVKKRKAAAQKSAVKKKGLTGQSSGRPPPSQTLGKVSAVKKQDRVKGAEAAPTQVEAAGAGASVPPAFPIVGVGASAGGLEAFEAFFKRHARHQWHGLCARFPSGPNPRQHSSGVAAKAHGDAGPTDR